jgi:hypothetical protein
VEPADQEIACFLAPMHWHLREQVRRFAEEEVRPRIAHMEQSRTVNHELSRLIARQGWIGVTVGHEYGGMAMGHRAKTVVIEELARVSGAMGAMVQASQLGVAKILHYGNAAQQAQWLPAIADGTCLPTIATTEAGSGSNVLGMAMTAKRDGDSYVLNGRKVWVGNSHICTASSPAPTPARMACRHSWWRPTDRDFRSARIARRWACTGSPSASWYSTIVVYRGKICSARKAMAWPWPTPPASSTAVPTSPPCPWASTGRSSRTLELLLPANPDTTESCPICRR